MNIGSKYWRRKSQRRERLLAYHIHSQIRTLLAVIILCACTITMGVGIHAQSHSAYAADLVPAPQRRIDFIVNHTPIGLGVMGVSADGRNVYCVQAGYYDELQYGSVADVSDSMEARKIAWLADHYQHNNDALTHAAIAVYIHDTIDADSRRVWPSWRVEAMKQIPDLAARVEQIKAEADQHVASVAEATMTYTAGHRTGNVRVQALLADGKPIEGVSFEVELTGPAVFDATGTSTVQGISSAEVSTLPWHATGNGKVEAHIRYGAPTLERLDSRQDYVRFKTMNMTGGQGVSFDVSLKFQPSLSSQATPHVLAPGSIVQDTITSAVAQGDIWKAHTTVRAHGYYFAGIPIDALSKPIEPHDGESPSAFIARVQRQGYAIRGYAQADLTHAGQVVTVSAHTKPDPHSALYRTSAHDRLGTWVWVIDTDRQPEGTKQWLTHDYISTFMEKAETVYSQDTLAIESIATEHTATIGSALSDTITVTGFPQDHGAFQGDTAAGLSADNTRMQVSVYWSGPDKQYKPTGENPPPDDEHHALIGTWEYPAVNGVVRVGNGTADIHGVPVDIVAEREGYYVFVLKFSGDSRVAAAQSRYDDAWERVWVTTPDPDEPPEPDKPPEPDTPPSDPPTPPEPTHPTEPQHLALTGTEIGGIASVAIIAASIGVGLYAARRRLQRHRA